MVLAIHPSLCYQSYRWYVGCVVSSGLIALLIQTEEDFRRLLVIAALSIGYLGARFGLFGLIHGGVRFGGGYGASFSDNNTLALALAMGVPLGWYAKDLIRSMPVRMSLLVSVFLTICRRGIHLFAGRRHRLGGRASWSCCCMRATAFCYLAGLAILTLPSIYLVKDSYVARMRDSDRRREGPDRPFRAGSRWRPCRVAAAYGRRLPADRRGLRQR